MRKILMCFLIQLFFAAPAYAAYNSISRIVCSDTPIWKEVDHFDVIFYGAADPKSEKPLITFNVIEAFKGLPADTKQIKLFYYGQMISIAGQNSLVTAKYGGVNGAKDKLEYESHETCNSDKDVLEYLRSPGYKNRQIWVGAAAAFLIGYSFYRFLKRRGKSS